MTAASGSGPDGYVLEEDELPAVGQGWGANRVSGREFMFAKSGGIMKVKYLLQTVWHRSSIKIICLKKDSSLSQQVF